jgi:DNA invertase Pin-like site-specific DNA recombinase
MCAAMTNRRPLRVALYLRVSTSDQSTALQRDEATRLIASRGWELAETYEDAGVSGTRARRPGLDAMLAAARRRRFDAIVVWRADRLFRSVHHMVTTLAELGALGVNFVSCTEPFDTSTPTGQLLLHLCAAFGQFERDVLVERTVAGMAAARRRGRRIGRPRARFDLEQAQALLAGGATERNVARALGVGYGTLRRALASAPKGSVPGAHEPA